MATDLLHLIGAGGHGRVVIDALLSQGWDTARIVVRDDRPELADTLLLGCKVEVPVRSDPAYPGVLHVAIGDADLREMFLADSGLPATRWLTVCHPRAVIASSSAIGEGCFVAASAVIGPCAIVGKGAIVNHGAVVDHDCRIGDFCHIGPNATLGGGVTLGKGVLIGAGANLLPGLRIGNGAVVGAGAAVLHDVPASHSVAGVPARNIAQGTR